MMNIAAKTNLSSTNQNKRILRDVRNLFDFQTEEQTYFQ